MSNKQWAAIFFYSLDFIACIGEHITDIYITETDTTELENLSHNIEIKNNKARHKIQIVNTARWT